MHFTASQSKLPCLYCLDSHW